MARENAEWPRRQQVRLLLSFCRLRASANNEHLAAHYVTIAHKHDLLFGLVVSKLRGPKELMNGSSSLLIYLSLPLWRRSPREEERAPLSISARLPARSSDI